jgi:hypothetical protein
MSEEPIVADTPDGVRFFTVRAVASAFVLEAAGMHLSRGSALKAARIQGLIPAGKRYTKRQGLEACIAELKRLQPDYEPPKSMTRALERL